MYYRVRTKEIDSDTAGDFYAELISAGYRDHARSPMYLDMSDVTHMDATGISRLLRAHHHLGGDGRAIRIVALSDQVRLVLKTAGLLDHFHVEDLPHGNKIL